MVHSLLVGDQVADAQALTDEISSSVKGWR
jgi:hypothetical protein